MPRISSYDPATSLEGVQLLGTREGAAAVLVPQSVLVAETGYTLQTIATLTAQQVPSSVDALTVGAYATEGDGGGHVRYRISAPSPAKAWHKQSADGAWWDVDARGFNARALGVSSDAADNTAAIADAIAYCRQWRAPLVIPAGTYYADAIDWDWVAGGYSRFTLRGDGFENTILRKLTDDGATFLTIGRNDSTQTFQGGPAIEDIAIYGIEGGSEEVLALWALTQFNLTNVHVRYGADGIGIHNCVTGMLQNVTAADAERGLYSESHVFDDATYSRSNLILATACAFKDNSAWGVDYAGGSQLVLDACQIENNGTVDGGSDTGGVRVQSSAGDFSTNRKGIALNSRGSWFESNKGLAAVQLLGGGSLFSGDQFVANADATHDVYTNGGKYTLLGVSMVSARPSGNVKDDTNAPTGSTIIGGEIAILSLDATKTSYFDVQSGTASTATRSTSHQGKALVHSADANQQIVITGQDSSASGSTVSFGYTFAAAPLVVLTVNANAASRVYSAKAYSISTTGFTIEKSYMTNGSSTVTNDSATVTWIAIGRKA